MLAALVPHNQSFPGMLRLGGVQVIADYLRTSIRWENVAANTKYTIMEMMSRGRHPHHLRVRGLTPHPSIQIMHSKGRTQSVSEEGGGESRTLSPQPACGLWCRRRSPSPSLQAKPSRDSVIAATSRTCAGTGRWT